MKKLLLTGIAALFLATGQAHANDQLPEQILGRWCEASTKGPNKIFYRPEFQGREGCVDFDDGVTFDENGFSNDSAASDSPESCEEWVFDKVERLQDNDYIISAHCGKAGAKYNPADDELGGTLRWKIVYDGLLIATRMLEG